jgi:hypothetical protein
MDIVEIAGATRHLGAPKDWDPARDGECGSLPIRDEPFAPGVNRMVSEWRPSPEEIELLAQGAPLQLHIIGTTHPVVALGVGSVPAKEKTMSKPTLCLDFDGVIHSYSSGWEGADVIPDPPVPGAIDFILKALEQFEVAIYSSRSKDPGGIGAMQDWLATHLVDYRSNYPDKPLPCTPAFLAFNVIQWPVAKPAAFVTLDDRAITFDGTWPEVDDLRAFKPWNKRV